MKRVYFVRHGKTEGNATQTYQSPEVPLSDEGLAGAEAVALRVATLDVDVVIASHFTRAQETAARIIGKTGAPLMTIDSFHEVLNASSVWGKPIHGEETLAYKQERLERFTDPTWGPDGAENYVAVMKRLKESVETLETLKAKNIVVVSHGNFLRHLTAYLLSQKHGDTDIHMPIYLSLDRMSNVGITEFTYDDGVWKLFAWNDHTHFAE